MCEIMSFDLVINGEKLRYYHFKTINNRLINIQKTTNSLIGQPLSESFTAVHGDFNLDCVVQTR